MKKYIAPAMSVEMFETSDVITASPFTFVDNAYTTDPADTGIPTVDVQF